jgi:hypothetical protein
MSEHLRAIIERHIAREPNTGCWLWTGAVDLNGYGQLTFRGAHLRAHRASLESHIGAIPPGMLVCHRCDVRSCVNPAHLYAGTYSDNRRDTLARSDWRHPYAARDACSRGHPYSSGFRIARDGSRECRECNRLHKAKYRAAAKQPKGNQQ